MKKCYTAPTLQLTLFSPRDDLAMLITKDSVDVMNGLTYAAGSQTETKPGDIFFPITP